MERDRLTVLWTTDNKTTFTEMVSMYTRNSMAHGWWKKVRIVIWGASATLVAKDQEVRDLIDELRENGVLVEACKACADDLGVAGELEACGVTVRYWGEALTEALQNDAVLSI